MYSYISRSFIKPQLSASRYDKYARTYAGDVLVAATVMLARP